MLVSDEQILQAQKVLAATTGIFAEPASAAAVAGLAELRRAGTIDSAGRTVVLITGHGLKDIDAAMRDIPMPPSVQPNLQAIAAALESVRELHLEGTPHCPQAALD